MPKEIDLEAALEAALGNESDTNSEDSQDGGAEDINFQPLKGDAMNADLTVVHAADGDSGLSNISFVLVNKTVVPTVLNKNGVYVEVSPAEVIKRVRLYLQKAGHPHTDEDIRNNEDPAFTHEGQVLFLTKKVVTALNANIKRKLKKEEGAKEGVKEGEKAKEVEKAKEKVKKPKAKPVKHDFSDDEEEEKSHKKPCTEGGVKPEEESDEDGDVIKSRPKSPKPDFEQPELQRELTSDDIVLTLRLPRSFIENGLKRAAASGH